MNEQETALRKAIGLAGGVTALAKSLGLDSSTVSKWTRIPLKHVLEIERAFPGEITRQEMRPDYFAPEAVA